jgi:hypothetical protein
MGERRLELFEEYRESGFDGKYERTTYYRLIVGEESRTATLEIEVVTRTFPGPSEQESITRYAIGVDALVKFIEKQGTRLAG